MYILCRCQEVVKKIITILRCFVRGVAKNYVVYLHKVSKQRGLKC
jgi:hypothetical protein